MLLLAERAAKDDEILSLANAALAACIDDDDEKTDTEEPEPTTEHNADNTNNSNSNTNTNNNHHNRSPSNSPEEESEVKMYRHELKRRLERLVEEHKAAVLHETQDVLISMASLGKNAKEKKKEMKKLLKDRKREEKRNREELEKLRKHNKNLAHSSGSSGIGKLPSLAQTFHFKVRPTLDLSKKGSISPINASTSTSTKPPSPRGLPKSGDSLMPTDSGASSVSGTGSHSRLSAILSPRFEAQTQQQQQSQSGHSSKISLSNSGSSATFISGTPPDTDKKKNLS